ncbi:hypothetical protein GMA12_05745 [Kocuria sediminis]|uniref:Uncharacterized protein n=1 Tax=Kocuria sediminis TaxID=1038857 RepID=A0A6N8GP97_9MICC|nr:hypothetical protein [Kocuria sediminis]MUN62644.1 hypothetical protein [Kocuria sediminis]
MSAPAPTPAPIRGTGARPAAGPEHRRAARATLPGIGVGTDPQIRPAAPATPLSRYRVRTDRPGLNLRAGEIVLCAVYEPASLGMVVLVRCESDGHAPGALLPVRELELVEHTGTVAGPVVWSAPGVRG